MNTRLLLLLIPFMLIACQFRNEDYIDFAAIETAQNLDFRVASQRETNLAEGIPEDCYLPDGTTLSTLTTDTNDTTRHSAPRQTSSTTGTHIYQELLKWGSQNIVTEIAGTYTSINTTTGEPLRLSGKVMLPKGRRPKRLILVSHYTVCSDAESPSNCFSIEGILVKSGYGLIIPDYWGYGITADAVHPYLVMEQTARNVLDMYFSVREWLKAVNQSPEKDDIYLMGYSQGAATTMAVEYLAETQYIMPENLSIRRVFVGGGPYDIKSTYENYVNTDQVGYPVAIPLVLQGMIKGNRLNVRLEDMMQPWLYNKMDEWINSKRYTSAQINDLINTHTTHNILTREAMEQTSDNVAELYKAMTVNSIISYNWTPATSIYMMHSIDDQTVSFLNATAAQSKWQRANIQYNFGHYGSHTQCALRFIYSVQSLLKEEEKEMKQYE